MFVFPGIDELTLKDGSIYQNRPVNMLNVTVFGKNTVTPNGKGLHHVIRFTHVDKSSSTDWLYPTEEERNNVLQDIITRLKTNKKFSLYTP